MAIPMEQDTQKKLDEMTAKLDAVYVSVEKTRKYFQVMLWVTVIVFVLPVLALIIAIPKFIDSYTSSLNGLL